MSRAGVFVVFRLDVKLVPALDHPHLMAGGGFGSDPVSSGLLCGDWVRVGEGASPMVPTCQLSHHNKISFQRNIFGFSRGKEREERPKVHPRVLVMIPPLALWHDTTMHYGASSSSWPLLQNIYFSFSPFHTSQRQPPFFPLIYYRAYL